MHVTNVKKKTIIQCFSANNRAVIKLTLNCNTKLQTHTVIVNMYYSNSNLFCFDHVTKDLAKETYE